MPEHLIDCTIIQAKKVTEGKSDKGLWELWKIVTDAAAWDGEEFTYFFSPKGKEPAPFVGMKLKHAELHEGEYNGKPQWTMKKLDSEEAENPPPASRKTGKQDTPGAKSGGFSPVSMYVSYAKDIWCAIQEGKQVKNAPLTIMDAVDEIVEGALRLKAFAEDPEKFKNYLRKKMADKKPENPE